MAHCQQQALIEAPVEEVWGLLSDPARYPEWAADSFDTTGYPTVIEQMSGYYSHWRLTEARGQTFADVQLGVEPIGVHGQVARLVYTKRTLRETLSKTLDGLKRTIAT